jgi:hypothetical protein
MAKKQTAAQKNPADGKVPPPAAKREKKQKERKSCLLRGGWY